MKQKMMLCLSLLIGVCGYTQSKFQKGYVIDNTGSKVECLIQNEDWKNNPSNFKYKLNESSKVLTGNLASVKEFSVGSSQKYINSVVDIDLSTKRITELSSKRTPEYQNKTLFLKVLIEGNTANLYSYYDGNLKRYFYSTASKKATQLVYKYYRTQNGGLGKNESYKTQLKDELSCSSIQKEPSYTKSSLTKYFIALNNCDGSDDLLTNYTTNETKGKLRLKIKGGVNMHTAEITNLTSTIVGPKTAKTNSNINTRFGIEIEYLLPLNNNRWSLFLEPTYQSFKDEATLFERGTIVTNLRYEIEYSSIELPIGARYYIPIKDKSKLFFNAAFVLDLPTNSSFVGRRVIKSGPNIILGAGFEFLDKFSAELRYNGGRKLLTNTIAFDSNYGGFALNLGYTIF